MSVGRLCVWAYGLNCAGKSSSIAFLCISIAKVSCYAVLGPCIQGRRVWSMVMFVVVCSGEPKNGKIQLVYLVSSSMIETEDV